MTDKRLYNVNIVSETLLPSPRQLGEKLPLTSRAAEFVAQSRKAIENIIDGKDKRLFLIVGPCSIHDIAAAREYATRLKALAEEVSDSMFLVMRTYFEKPRTTVGWKGFINDPNLDDSFKIGEGLSKAREFLLELAELGVPAGKEALDPITPQYLSELLSWYAIGARTTESQTHREMASGLSSPVGFKNNIDGDISVAVNALRSVSSPHHFLGIDIDGRSTVFQTRGNRYGHVILRGGQKPNYDAVSVASAEAKLSAAGLAPVLMVDCSHGNSAKDFRRQPIVFKDCISQVTAGNRSIVGMMMESHLNEGRQDVTSNLENLQYGVSVTDGCISWQTTEEIIRNAHRELTRK